MTVFARFLAGLPDLLATSLNPVNFLTSEGNQEIDLVLR